MLLSELLHMEVLDADGERVGNVDDVRLVRDGPYVEGFGAALRVDAFVVGSGGIAVRLGYHRHRVKGPWLLKRVFTALERRARFVLWEQVDSYTEGSVRLSCRKDELRTLHEE